MIVILPFSAKKLLENIAKVTGGMYVMVHNMSELSTFFRRQVLLSRFIAKFAHGKFKAVISWGSRLAKW